MSFAWPRHMVLIVDTFEVPALLVSRRLFRSPEVVELREASLETIGRVVSSDAIYCIHKECFSDDDIRCIKYYFNEVVEVLSSVRYINKSKKVVKYYSVVRGMDGSVEDLAEIKDTETSSEASDKTAFLPYIGAQDEEIVIFPDDDE